MILNNHYDRLCVANREIATAREKLLAGDTNAARKGFNEAASILVSLSKKMNSKEFFLHIANLYFDSGDYRQCVNYLSSENERLHKEAHRRQDKYYQETTKTTARDYFANGHYKELFNFLKEHYPCFTPEEITSYRKNACEKLGQKELADLFSKDLEKIKC